MLSKMALLLGYARSGDGVNGHAGEYSKASTALSERKATGGWNRRLPVAGWAYRMPKYSETSDLFLAGRPVAMPLVVLMGAPTSKARDTCSMELQANSSWMRNVICTIVLLRAR